MMDLMFLKLDGVRGESYAPRHIGEIEIISFSWGNPEGQGVSPGGGGGAGKLTLHDMIFSKKSDKTTSELHRAAANGQHFTKAVLTIERVTKSGSLLRSFTFTMKSILIKFVSPSNSSGHGDVYPIETVELSFGEINIKES